MKAMRAVNHQYVPWGGAQGWRREVDFRARDEILTRLFKEDRAISRQPRSSIGVCCFSQTAYGGTYGSLWKLESLCRE